MIRLTLFFALVLACFSAQAQQQQRLNDGWEFIRTDLSSPWEAVRPVVAGGAETVPIWEPVKLPHCFNAWDAVDPDVNYYQGPAWYRTRLFVDNPYHGGRTLLHFEGAGQKTRVYVYDRLIGEHVGGYDEWSVDITDAVEEFRKLDVFKKQFRGCIPISIRTDNSRDAQMIPSSLSDFNIYGGIYRYLDLVYAPARFIQTLGITTVTDEQGKAAVLMLRPVINGIANGVASDPRDTASYKTPATDSVTIRVMNPAGKAIFNRKFPLTDSIRIDLRKVSLWSPAHPSRYTVEAAMGEAVLQEHFGFKHIGFITHGPFKLNGERLLLRGTHRHEDHAGVGAAMTEDMMRSEMISIKEMGVNFIRLGHYQQSRIILDLCDSLGILVWEEIPWCRGGLGGQAYQQQAKDMLTNMITQHRHHPSVIIWGLGNENDWPNDFPVFDTLRIRNFMMELNDLSHRLDPGRMTAIRRCDFAKDIVDVYSPSIWAGWYRGVYTEYKAIAYAEMQKVDHFLHVEWGGDSHAGRHSENPDKVLQKVIPLGKADERSGDASLIGGAARVSKDGDWSESYICNLIDWHLREQETMPWLTGSAQWPFKDFSTPLRPDNPVPYVNQKGAVTRDGTPKESYYVYQSYWALKPMIHVYGHTWPIRWGKEGEVKMIKVYSNCETAELYVNGKSQGIRKRASQDFPAAGLRWELPLHKGRYEVKVIGRKAKVIVTDSISCFYETAQWGKATRAVLQQVAGSNDTATVEVSLYDANGIACLDSSTWVRFGLTGDGSLIDNMGTPGASRYVQMNNGRARISVRVNGGKSVLAATVGDLPVQFISLGDDAVAALRPVITSRAAWAMKQPIVTVTDSFSARSAGGRHDFFSEGDYWWPNPQSPDSPYVQRDGLSNPSNFNAHRRAMINFSRVTGSLGSMYKITKDEAYVTRIMQHCKAWFNDTATRMNPNLLYAQAIHGRATGRGIGIIDAIQLVEVVKTLELIEPVANDPVAYREFRAWFAAYLQWVTTHPYGIDEMNANNNHGTCWVMQVAVFAGFTGNDSLLTVCRNRYRDVLLPKQMAADGSFPLELKRTKPYGYSLFNLDAMATICQELSRGGHAKGNDDADDHADESYNDLWNYHTTNGRSIELSIEFMERYIRNKPEWKWPKDVMYWDEWPVAQPALYFGGEAYSRPEWLHTWSALEHDPQVDEVIRNLPVRNPLLWTTNRPGNALPHVFWQIAQQEQLMLQEIPVAKKQSAELVAPRTVENGALKLVPSKDWTSGFFAGELWMMYAYTRDTAWKNRAELYTQPIGKEQFNGGTHDMGFKIWCSYGTGYRLTHDKAYEGVIVQAAKTLITRFNAVTGVIRSWDNRARWANPVIIDNMMNLELLFEASAITGDTSFRHVAISHANTTLLNHFRTDNSSFHVVDYDTVTGQVLQRTTHQGYADWSAWSRGQAWGIYGFTMCYRYTKDPRYLDQAEKIAEYMLHHPNMPEDGVPYWDYNAPLIPDEERDASAAAVLASGLLELAQYSGHAFSYRASAMKILNSLTDHYRSPVGSNHGFILLHSTGSKPAKSEVDVPLSYADYYYLEALMRSGKPLLR